MADDEQFYPGLNDGSDPEASPTYGDYAKTAGASVTGGVLAPAAAAVRNYTERAGTKEGELASQMAAVLQKGLNSATDSLNESRTDAAKQHAEAAVTSPEFWEHPISASMLKATGMSGPMAAMVFSGGPVAAAIVNGGLSAGTYLNDVDKILDGKSDEDLKSNEWYASLRSMGMSEDDARADLKKKLIDNKALYNFAAGAVAGALGPAGKLAAGVSGKAAVGLAGTEAGTAARAALGGVEGGVGGALQGGTENATVQQTEIEGGLKKTLDKDALVNAVLEPALIGGVAGAAAGAAVGRSKKSKSSEITPELEPDAIAKTEVAQEQGGGEPNTAVEAAPAGGPEGTPDSVPPATPGAKGEAVKAVIKKKRGTKTAQAEIVEAGAPSAEQTLAIADKQQPTTPSVPPDVAAAAARVAKPETVEAPTAVPEAAQAPSVPDDVVAASKQVAAEAPPAEPAPVVTPEVTPAPEAAPTAEAPAVSPEAAPAKPRILPNISPEAIEANKTIEAQVKAKAAETRQRARQVLKSDEEKSPTGKHFTKEEIAAREENASNAKKIFDEHVPDEAAIPTDKAGRDALQSRLGSMVESAEKSGVKIPTKVGYEGTSDHVVYLRAAKDLHRKLGQKSFTGSRRDQQISDFMIAERAAKSGDFSVLRETRKVEGDLAMRRDQGNVEEKGSSSGTAGAEAEKEPVQTAVSKSARGAVRDSASEERVASPGKVLKGAEKAAAIKALNESLAKGKAEAARVDRAEVSAAKPVEAVSARAVDKAAKATNTEPTEGQKKAGNYAKATVKWHGMDIAIENPKGSKRTGKDAGGREWSVEMPDHYGYVKRTEGADGDAVDVYMGSNPKSERVFVIDQQDFSGKFDEHKAMLGYDSRADAMTAYDQAFSDGRGFERIKDIQEMTPAEFKEWANSDKPKKAYSEEERAYKTLVKKLTEEDVPSEFETALVRKDRIAREAVQRAIAEQLGDEPLVADHAPKTTHVSDFRTGELAIPLRTISADEALKSLDLGHLNGVAEKVQPFLARRLKELVGDTPVHFIDEWDMARLSGADAFSGDFGPLGTYFFDPKNGNRIHVRADLMSDPARVAHTVIHEATHAATMRALRADEDMAHTVSLMMKETIEFMGHNPRAFDEMRYAFTNIDEFMAEGFSNPEVQRVLAHTPVSPELAGKLGLGNNIRGLSMWDMFVGMVKAAITKIVGPIPGGHSMLEAVIRAGERQMKATKEITQPAREARALELNVREKVEGILKRPELQDQEAKPWLLKWRTMDQLAQSGAEYGLHQVRRVTDLVEMIRMKGAANLRKSEPIVAKLYELERKHKASGMWEKFTSLVHDETMANTFADRDLAANTQLGKDALEGMWGKAQHAGLAARFKELPEDLRQARVEAMKFFTEQQNAMSLGIIKNRILKTIGVEDDGLARRIHEGSTTDADAALLGGAHTLELIKEAKELAKITGPYFPLMRRGDHVVRATYDVAAPANGTKVSPNQFDFNSRQDAIDFAKKQDTRPSIESRWVDKTTGEPYGVEKDGKRIKVTANDVEAVQKFRVTVQNEHVEFFNSAKEAQAAAKALEGPGITVKGVEERRFEPGDRQSDMLSHQMKQLVTSLERRDGYKDMTPAMKNEMVQALNEASIRFLGSTRIQSRRLPRRYVEGASKDLTRNTLDYAQSTSGYLAKLEHQPALDDAMKAMREGVTGNENKTTSLARSSIANEIEQRVATSSAPYETGGVFNEAAKRVMTLSFLDKLFSPAFNIINSLQPAMVTMPTLAARYGVGKSFDAMSRAYRDISGLSIVGKGLKDTVAKARDSQADTTNFLGEIMGRLSSSKERAMLQYLADRGSIDPESGMEISALVKARDGVVGKIDTGLGYMEGIARQMPQAIETMNRAVTALATYRLEVGRGGSHEAAMQKAQESVNNTQGLYSATNAAPIFHHPVAKLSLQFKKYGQMMYHLLGSNIGKALRNAEPGDRAEALKTLAGLVATHTAMAGALGLPTEPFKYLLMGAQAAGLTTTGWSDVEDKVRQGATNFFGKTGGEIFTRGLPHALGVDLSSRVGLDSLTSFGEPKSYKDSDVKTWLFDTIAGAPASLVGDWIKGANQLTSGNYAKAAELMVPNKLAADSIKAYRLATEGKTSAAGKETMSPYSVRETATRVLGFTPARESEQSAKQSAFYNASKSQDAERKSLVSGWVSAKPQDKAAAYRAVQKWNAGVPKEAKIQMSDLTKAAKNRSTEKAKGRAVDGVSINKQNKYLMDRAAATYNP
ncbi:PLxRFG domain-containing protein [Bradyrhizobium cenepequi]